MTPVVVLVVALLAVVATSYAVSYNRLVRSREQVSTSWATVEAELQLRHDLAPQLVAVVERSAAHEREVVARLADRHRRAVEAPPGVDGSNAVEPGLTAAIAAVVALRERYPGLDTSDDFLALQRRIATAEDRIAAARRFFNTRVTELNRRVEAFPSGLVARRHGFERAAHFDLDPEDRSGSSADDRPRFGSA